MRPTSALRTLPAVLTVIAALAFLAVSPGTIRAQSGSYGAAVVLDGGELFVGEPNTSFREGSVYIYERTGEGEGEGTGTGTGAGTGAGARWTETQRLTAPRAARADGFGTALAKYGSTLVAGQRGGPLHIFEKGVSEWQHSGTLTGEGTRGLSPECNPRGYCGTDFGITRAMNEDWLLVGAPGGEPNGQVHVYQRTADGEFDFRATLQAADATPNDRFGAAILLQGRRAFVGAPTWDDTPAGLENVGRVTEFRFADGAWTEAGSLPFFSESAAQFGSAFSWRPARRPLR